MTCKILFFDLKDCEQEYFNNCRFNSFDIKFFQDNFNNDILKKLETDDFETRMMICTGEESQITSDMLMKFKNLRLIARRGANCSNIDLQFCRDNNIAVINVENNNGNCEKLLNATFAGMSSFLCGGKENRVV